MIKSLTDLPTVRAFLDRIGAEPRSLKTAVVLDKSGKYWKDIAVIGFTKDGEASCKHGVDYLPTDTEAALIKAEFAGVRWPELKLLDRIVDAPPMVKNADPKDVFEFRNTDGKIVMLQVRTERKGKRSYIPYTYWSDDQWRSCEPDGPLPLYNAHLLKDAATVFIHEGAKAARRCQWMVDGKSFQAKDALASHPWGQELTGAVHLGWTGGAQNPERTDWSDLKRQGIKRAYIVADNDKEGKSAVPAISKQLRIAAWLVQFTDAFPTSFDLADDFPDEMFGEIDDLKIYTGPTFRELLAPATWATDLINQGKGRPLTVLRDCFKGQWTYVEDVDVFVCNESPDIMRNDDVLNKALAPFSDVQKTAHVIRKSFVGATVKVCYRPDDPGTSTTYEGHPAINIYRKSTIRPVAGDAGPWEEFLNYLFVREEERHVVKRWCATLIAKPEVRMGYAMLLISESQGTGKSTLGAAVLAPLVGLHNTGSPSEADIVNSDFNGWAANKRLVVVHEIYGGASWKAYHKLKPIITEKTVSVNEKYMRSYEVDNWCHVFACSNSMRALKMEIDDRRWFYPEVTETKWPNEKFVELRRWLSMGGLNIIQHWAENFGDYIGPAEKAPMTERKKDMIQGSRSEAQTEVAALAEVMQSYEKPVAVVLSEVTHWVRSQVQGKVFDSDYELSRAMKEEGAKSYGQRIKIQGKMSNVLMNSCLADLVQRASSPAEAAALIREHKVRPSDLIAPTM